MQPINEKTHRKKYEIKPFNFHSINPLKYNSPKGLIEINHNNNLIIEIKNKRYLFIISPCGTIVQLKKRISENKTAEKAYKLE